MADRVTTSFIPKESLSQERTPSVAPVASPYILVNVVATFILISGLIASGGIFIANVYSDRQVTLEEESLASNKASFNPETIGIYDRLARRIHGARSLLTNHVSPTLVLEEVEATTMLNLQFKNLTLTANRGTAEGGTKGYDINMAGEAKSFNSIALQANVFAESTIIKDPLFSGVTTAETNTVVFQFTGHIPTNRITYAERIQKEATVAP